MEGRDHKNLAMAAIVNTLCALLFFALITQGNCQCEPVKNLKLTQAATGAQVENKPQFQVTISNDCLCGQSNIVLSCDGFQSVEQISPSVLAKSGGDCSINNGQPVHQNQPFSFTYAWDSQFPFQIKQATLGCS